jgi:hypothetical protein
MMVAGLRSGHAEIYNGLGAVEDVDELVRNSKDLDGFLRAFAEETVAAGLVGIAGVFLLHRHFLVTDESAMVEAPEVLTDGRRALISRRQTVPVGAEAVRWKWQSLSGEFCPLEFSKDGAARSGSLALSSQPQYLRGVGRLLEQYEMQELMGLTVVARELQADGPDVGYLERNTSHESVVTLEPGVGSLDDAISTTWAPIAPSDASPTMKCITVCRCVGHGNAHRREHNSFFE